MVGVNVSPAAVGGLVDGAEVGVDEPGLSVGGLVVGASVGAGSLQAPNALTMHRSPGPAAMNQTF